MKLLMLSFVAVCFTSMFFGQTITVNSQKQTNGVVVHSAPGVEQPITSQEKIEIRTVEDWNLAECIDALKHLELKCAQSTPAECAQYDSYKARIEKRKGSIIESK